MPTAYLSKKSKEQPKDVVFPYTLELAATAFNMAQVDDHVATLTPINEAQVAFAGRSNVGKSSLLNALAGRKNLARISSTPGKTRSVNFYRVLPDGFTLTDLPGYGYAKCSQTERQFWARLIEHYVSNSPGLRGLTLLLDCRLDPQKLDRDLADYAQNRGIPLIPVLTKADKCTQVEQAHRRKQWGVLLGGQLPHVVSSEKRRGLAPLWDAIVKLVNPAGESTPKGLSLPDTTDSSGGE